MGWGGMSKVEFAVIFLSNQSTNNFLWKPSCWRPSWMSEFERWPHVVMSVDSRVSLPKFKSKVHPLIWIHQNLSCVSLLKLLNFSVLQFLHLQMKVIIPASWLSIKLVDICRSFRTDMTQSKYLHNTYLYYLPAFSLVNHLVPLSFFDSNQQAMYLANNPKYVFITKHVSLLICQSKLTFSVKKVNKW